MTAQLTQNGREIKISLGNRTVVAYQESYGITANLWVNTRNGMQYADITSQSWKGKTVKGLQKWAEKVLA